MITYLLMLSRYFNTPLPDAAGAKIKEYKQGCTLLHDIDPDTLGKTA
jgi:hypothetical protein